MSRDDIEEITPDQFDASWGDRGQVYDANGRRLEYVRRWNLRTGEVTRYVRDEKGGFATTHNGWAIATVTERHPAPLTFVPA
ncbi:unnamed protein product [Gemmataceae bacterium]|nr:unnamed protein product [Gemmataceae bacterium]VTT96554.1 unnamed protein product [Gemmataceae bacterium]